MFYEYIQNNSFGRWNGPHIIIIEADSPEEADQIAEEKTPIYFNGCSTGKDCPCCGDRWGNAYGDGDEYPSIWGKRLEDYRTIYGEKEIDVYFKNGKIEKLIATKNEIRIRQT